MSKKRRLALVLLLSMLVNIIGPSLPLLAPPKKPSATGWRVALLVFSGILAISIVGFGALSLSLLALTFYLRLLPDAAPLALASAAAALPLLLLSLAGFALGIALIYLGLRHDRATQRRLAAQIHRWQMALHRWRRLYYCARDDGVFIPGETGFVPLRQMHHFLCAD